MSWRLGTAFGDIKVDCSSGAQHGKNDKDEDKTVHGQTSFSGVITKAMTYRITITAEAKRVILKLKALLGRKAFIPKAMAPYSTILNRRLAVFSRLL